MSGKGDKRLHARTQAPADDMAARWERTFGVSDYVPTSPLWSSTIEPGECTQLTPEKFQELSDRILEDYLASLELNPAERDALWRRIQRERGSDD